MWRILSRVVIVIAILLAAFRLADRISRRTSALPPVPTPNGYETLLRVSREVTPLPSDHADATTNDIIRVAELNRAALAHLSQAVRTNTAVPLQVARGWSDEHNEDLKSLKRLALLLAVQSRADLLGGRTNDAASAMLDTVLLGQALAKGGLLVDGLSGLAVEAVGAASLRSMLPQLNAEVCRKLARELELAESRRETAEHILQTEKTWSARSFGLVSRIGGLMAGGAGKRRAGFVTKYHEITRRTRVCMLALAARTLELETGKRPTNPAELVPAVLGSVPMDPGKNRAISELPANF